MEINRSSDENSRKGIGGWLILIATLLIFVATYLAYSLWYIAGVLISENVKIARTHSGYNTSLELFVKFEFLVNFIFLSVLLFLIYLFFKRDKKFPKLSSSYGIIISLWVLIDTISMDLISRSPILLGDVISDTLVDLLIAISVMAYMMKSKRVRITFIN